MIAGLSSALVSLANLIVKAATFYFSKKEEDESECKKNSIKLDDLDHKVDEIKENLDEIKKHQ